MGLHQHGPGKSGKGAVVGKETEKGHRREKKRHDATDLNRALPNGITKLGGVGRERSANRMGVSGLVVWGGIEALLNSQSAACLAIRTLTRGIVGAAPLPRQ